ncbi:MAG TPA: methyltransferase domain-containing protein [Acidimicrobiales bacterium]|nr:methyltransferase domain-containing protein [Acidimicrobiales bacterium]
MEANQLERRRWNDPSWAESWPKRERFTDPITPVLMEALALQPGERVLDIGCGGGKAALRAAEAVGGEGAVVGADISVPLAGLASRRSVEAGAKNVSFRVLDVQTQRVEGGPFDVAMSQFGVMFFDEPERAFANVRSQLVVGGRIGFACWQAVDENPWFFAGALMGIVPPPPTPEPGKSPTGPFALADPDRVRSVLEEAGFAHVSLKTHELSVDAPEDAIVDEAQLAFMGVPEERMAAARVAVDGHMSRFRQPSGLSRFPLAFQVVTADNAAG